MIWVRGVGSQPYEFDKFNGAPIFVKANAFLTFSITGRRQLLLTVSILQSSGALRLLYGWHGRSNYMLNLNFLTAKLDAIDIRIL